MAKKKSSSTMSDEQANQYLSEIMNNVGIPSDFNWDDPQLVQNDYYARQQAKAGIKGTSQMIGGSVGPNPQAMFHNMQVLRNTDYLKGVKPDQLGTVKKPNPFSGVSGGTKSNSNSNSSSNTSSNSTSNTGGTTVKVTDYVGSNDWPDIVAHYFPKGAGNYYRNGGQVKRMAEGGLVRGGGVAVKGRGRGRMT